MPWIHIACEMHLYVYNDIELKGVKDFKEKNYFTNLD